MLIFFLIASGWTLDLAGQAQEILTEIWAFHPVAATQFGIHKYDGQMPDYSKNSLIKRTKRFKQLKEQLLGIDTLVLSIDELVDYYLLVALLNDELFDLETRNIYEQNPLVYVQACINGVYTIMIRHATSPQERMRPVSARVRQVPGFLEVARQNLKRPCDILCEIGINQLIEGEKFIEGIYESYKDSLPEAERLEFQQAKVAAVAAMMRFGYWLEKNQDKGARYYLGKENYDYRLRNVHFIDIDADSILRIGEHYLALAARMIDSLDRLLQPSARQMVTLPQDFGREDVVRYRVQEVNNLRDYVMAANIVTVPEWVGEIQLVETPLFLRTLIPGVAMIPPGPYDESKTSIFFTPALPIIFDLAEAEYFYNYIHNRWFLSSAVHEAFPGHHLQLSIANHHLSVVRRTFHDYFFVEGWALYCEELMAKSGFYEDTIGAMINALEGVRYRAARVIVDVKLQTGVFDYEDALQFMVDTFGGSEGYYSREIKRYISNPIQPSSYLIGKIQLQELRQKYERMKGNDVGLKDFHDELLSHGSIPFMLMRRLMLASDK